jgi:hypothetical protein
VAAGSATAGGGGDGESGFCGATRIALGTITCALAMTTGGFFGLGGKTGNALTLEDGFGMLGLLRRLTTVRALPRCWLIFGVSIWVDGLKTAASKNACAQADASKARPSWCGAQACGRSDTFMFRDFMTPCGQVKRRTRVNTQLGTSMTPGWT